MRIYIAIHEHIWYNPKKKTKEKINRRLCGAKDTCQHFQVDYPYYPKSVIFRVLHSIWL